MEKGRAFLHQTPGYTATFRKQEFIAGELLL